MDNVSDAGPSLPPPPPFVPHGVKPERIVQPSQPIMARKGLGTSGRRIWLHSNHFRAFVDVPNVAFYQYSVSITSEDHTDVIGKGIGREVMDKLYQIYSSELRGRKFAYDGEKILYTVGELPQKKMEFIVALEESSEKQGRRNYDDYGSNSEPAKRLKRSIRSRSFKVEITYTAKIPLKSITSSLRGAESSNITQDSLRVLDTILRQQAANRGYLLVRQSFFRDNSKNIIDIGEGVNGLRGFYSTFQDTQDGLSLNIDVSTILILKPGPVVDFLCSNQNVKDPNDIDWMKAKRMLKNLRIKALHRGKEFKIRGLSEKPCNKQYFSMRCRDGNGSEEITVYEYFWRHCNIRLSSSANLPCLDVGKPNRPNFLPIELCELVSLQRYTKALSPMQRASFADKSRQKPEEKKRVLVAEMDRFNYDDDPLLQQCGIRIEKQFTRVEGRVLDSPKLRFGQGDDFIPRNGRWNFNNKTLLEPIRIDAWIIVNFSARCDVNSISRQLSNCGAKKGINIKRPMNIIEEDPRYRRVGPVARVEKIFEAIRNLSNLQFILCVLPERKNSDIYGPWKKKCLCEHGIVTQCMSPLRINDQYLTNLLLKINAKLGGVNSLLDIEHSLSVPIIRDAPTMILGMDVCHGSVGRLDPSVAAVVGSLQWPRISRYRAAVRTQSPKLEIIDALYKPKPNGEDAGIIRELLLDFYHSSNCRKPSQIILFRDGVSESQFNKVLDIELDQIAKAYMKLDGSEKRPKFTVIIAQKRHHTKLFQAGGSENVPPGTIVEKGIVHPQNYDFYLCAHAGMIGTSRPVHYHVLLDEIGFTPDQMQNFIHSLSYVYQRSTTATSLVAPISYAHLAAKQVAQFMKFEDSSDTSSTDRCITSVGSISVPELPKLSAKIVNSMFFC